MRNSHWAASLLMALLLPACGSSGPSVMPTPTPVPCTQATVFQVAGSLPAHTADFESVTTTTTGRLDVTLDWCVHRPGTLQLRSVQGRSL